jgi:serine protease AprX
MFFFLPVVFFFLFLAPPQVQEVEFLVVLREQADLQPAYALNSKAERGQFTRDALLGNAERTQADLRAWLEERRIPHRPFYIVNAIWVQAPQSVADEIAARPDVARVEANPRVRLRLPDQSSTEPSDAVTNAITAIESGVTAIRAPEVWALGYRGEGITIASADTGVQWDHPALKNKYRGWDGATANHNFNWHDSTHTGGGACGPNSPVPCDDNSHGTHTTGTAVGDDGSGNQIGVAPGAKFIACRNMNEGVGTPASYLECMEFFLAPYPVGGTPAQGDPSKAPDITINSWTCPPQESCSQSTLRAAVEAQRAAGIMMVVAAGNDGAGCSTISDPPSHYDASFTVGALNTNGTIAGFSSRGPSAIDQSGRIKPDISAPGVAVRSSVRGNTYSSFQGTSMATPHVAGAIALLWSAHPELRRDIVATENILNHSAVPVPSFECASNGRVPNNTYGWGRLDIKSAVDIATKSLGRVTSMGFGLPGVTVHFARISGSGSVPPPVITDAQGKWSQNGFDPDSRYMAYPQLGNYLFHPRWREFTGITTAIDFQTTSRRLQVRRGDNRVMR